MKLVIVFMIALFLLAGCGSPESSDGGTDLRDKAQAKIDGVLGNPAATVDDLLGALEVAQALPGFESEIKELQNRIDEALMKELLDPLICKKRARELLAAVQQMGSDLPHGAELEKLAEAKTKIGTDTCGEAPTGAESTITFDMMNTIDEGEGTKYLVKQTSKGSIKGKLQEYTLLGMRSEDSRSYTLTGDINWNYEEWYLDGCTLKISTSTGSENGKKLGSLTKYNDGTYAGDFSLPIKLQVNVKPAGEGFLYNRVAESSPESVDEAGEAENMRNIITNMCAEVQSETTEEDGSVNVNFNGDVNNYLATLPGGDKRSKTVLTDDINKQGRGDDGDYSTKITYTLSLPE